MTGPYDKEPDSAGCCDEPSTQWRSPDSMGADGKRPYGKRVTLNERAKAMTRHIRCLGTERSEARVTKSGIPSRACERRAGDRASIGAGKRVTSAERREAGRWMCTVRTATTPASWSARHELSKRQFRAHHECADTLSSEGHMRMAWATECLAMRRISFTSLQISRIHPSLVVHRLESRMREIRLSGSEGGGARFGLSLPL